MATSLCRIPHGMNDMFSEAIASAMYAIQMTTTQPIYV